METNERYELMLWHISVAEYDNYAGTATYQDYRELALQMLMEKKLFISEKDEQAQSEDLSQFPNRYFESYIYVEGGFRRKIKIWYDLCAEYLILPEDANYDVFFAYKLRHLDLLEIDSFLSYQLEKWYQNNVEKLRRFIQLVLRKHEQKILNPKILLTVNEWLAKAEKLSELSGKALNGNETELKKLRLEGFREPGENLTQLNLEQNALLMYCLRETKLVLSKAYLNDKKFGMAFSILTGYSADSLRQRLNQKLLAEMVINKENIEAVEKALKDLKDFIRKKA